MATKPDISEGKSGSPIFNDKWELVGLYNDADGVIRFDDSRVPLDAIVIAFKQGAAPEEIASQYPTLRLADIYSAIGYYLNNQDKTEAYLKTRQANAQKLRQKVEAHQGDRQSLRERLLARKAETG